MFCECSGPSANRGTYTQEDFSGYACFNCGKWVCPFESRVPPPNRRLASLADFLRSGHAD